MFSQAKTPIGISSKIGVLVYSRTNVFNKDSILYKMSSSKLLLAIASLSLIYIVIMSVI